ncbi:DUF4214 domain-containing protein [Modicisalibacter radicis]|uniref:DUF4214 domain-containing protein n=1 Tax=Halomonas sp. EAR18 TaxID=2518972 RepID=UPI00109C2D99|nr:DUF4214 domain-containing protein [Halomonas sp. EAR18]
MATQASENSVQQLYVAYYGRPADQDGLQYWADRLESEGESAIINAFGNSEEYQAMAEGQGNATLVNNLYEQMFGRDADPEGLAYYTGVLNSGEKSLAEIALTIKNAASGVDLNDFNAKVEAAAEYTATYGSAEDYDIVAAKDVVTNAEGGLYTPELTPAIEEYQAAQEAVSDYLKGDVVSNEAVVAELSVDAEDATDAQIDTALSDAVTAAQGEVETAGSITLDSNASVAAAQIDAKQDELEKAVSDAQDTVNSTSGLNAAISSLQSAESRFESALTANSDASDELTGETAKFDALNATGSEAYAVDANAGDSVLVTYDDGQGGGAVDFLVVNGDGEVELDSNFTASNYEGLDALISDAQAQYDAEQSLATQQTAFEKAAEKVINLEADITNAAVSDGGGYSVTDNAVTLDLANADTGSAPNAQDLLNDQAALSTFNEAVADYQELTGLQSQVDDLNDAVSEAADTIEEQGVNLSDAATGGTAENDVFIFDDSYAGQTIAGFGTDGEDQLYIGDSFTAVQLGSDVTLTDDAAGDVNTLEVFFQQSGNDTVLSFENKAFAGSAENGFDGAQVTLTGVNADDLQVENGYISIA